jgi:hypothetical protein
MWRAGVYGLSRIVDLRKAVVPFIIVFLASVAPACGGSFESETWSFHMV